MYLHILADFNLQPADPLDLKNPYAYEIDNWRRISVRELEFWIVLAFTIITCWSLFGLIGFSHSYVMFMPLDESLKYDDKGNTIAGVTLVLASCAYAAVAFIRMAALLCGFALRKFRADGAATPFI
ncbi:hypothetical protein [Methylobacterium sp. CM6257]